jgi:uncharacterized protein YcaQ
MAVMRRRPSLSAAQARRVAIAAQGLARPRPAGSVSRRQLRRLFAELGAVQIDSVNVLARAHYLPAYSRLGDYPAATLDRLAYRDREIFECWAHEASLLPVVLHPLFRWRMARTRDRFDTWGGIARLAREQPGYVAGILAEVRDRGPLTGGDLAQPEVKRREHWGWNWHDGKIALEWLFRTGELAIADRRGFQRVYDLPERVLPARVLDEPTPLAEQAQRSLLLRAASALGVATYGDLIDYFRMPKPEGGQRVGELVDAGELLPVTVEGWPMPGYVRPELQVPRRVDARALVAPFDPLVWERSRTARLFGFDYRIEIYVPAARRVHGYYVLPFLLGDRLVARVDLKADRRGGRLLVRAAYAEPGTDVGWVAAELAGELAAMAGWLGLADGIEVADRGDLAGPLAAANAAAR